MRGQGGNSTRILSTLGEAGKLASGYLGELEVCGGSPNTIRHHAYTLEVYLQHLEDAGVDFRATEYKDIITFLQALRLKGNKDISVRSRLSAVSAWYKWLKRVKVVKENPCELVPSIKIDRSLPQFFSEGEMMKLREAAKTYSRDVERNTALLEFVYASACRRGEVSRLNVQDLDLGDSSSARIRMTKGRRERLVILDAPSFISAWKAYAPIRAKLLSRWERPQEPAAFVTKYGKRMGGGGIRDVIKALCCHAGVRVLYPHAIRHSAATHMLNNGDDLENIREQLGHVSLSTTQVYLHVALDRRRAQYRKSHPAAAGPSSPPATS